MKYRVKVYFRDGSAIERLPYPTLEKAEERAFQISQTGASFWGPTRDVLRILPASQVILIEIIEDR